MRNTLLMQVLNRSENLPEDVPSVHDVKLMFRDIL